jgi:hypothetical protein
MIIIRSNPTRAFDDLYQVKICEDFAKKIRWPPGIVPVLRVTPTLPGESEQYIFPDNLIMISYGNSYFHTVLIIRVIRVLQNVLKHNPKLKFQWFLFRMMKCMMSD